MDGNGRWATRRGLPRSAGHHQGARFAGRSRALGRANHPLDCASPVDLLVRTSGEQRLSDFLLWECAYAELHFVDTFWPDFGAADVEEALLELSRRQRRFGGFGESPDRNPAEEGDRIAAGVR